jgi:Fe-S cluster assembly scaffold protein SufB
MQHQVFAFNNEPSWIKEYRKKHEELAQSIPLHKSKYADTQKVWERLQQFSPATISGTSKNAQIYSWENALEAIPHLQQLLEKETMPRDRFEAHLNAHFSSGNVIVVHETAELVEITIDAQKPGIMKNVIIVEGNAHVIVRMHGNQDTACVETVSVQQGVNATIVHIHNAAGKNIFYQQTLIEKDALLHNSQVWLQGTETTALTTNNLLGQGSSIKQFDVEFSNAEQALDYTVYNHHANTDTTSYSVFKAVVDGKATSIFDGMIKIPKTSQRSNALLEAHSMLLSSEAHSNNIPGLEIEADDVKATHSASVEQLDNDHLFYLQARGIDREIARKTIVNSFLESVIFQLPHAFHDILTVEVTERLEG